MRLLIKQQEVFHLITLLSSLMMKQILIVTVGKVIIPTRPYKHSNRSTTFSIYPIYVATNEHQVTSCI